MGNKRSGQSQERHEENRKEGDPELEVGQNKAAKPRIMLQMHSITKEISRDCLQSKVGKHAVSP